MLEVEPTAEVAETATKPSPAPLQKHSLGGCTIDMPLSSAGGISFLRAISCFHFVSETAGFLYPCVDLASSGVPRSRHLGTNNA